MNLRTYFSICCLAALFSCQNRTQSEHSTTGDKSTAGDSTGGNPTRSDQEQKYCFLRTEGTQQQDSSYVQLAIRKETVTGVFNVIPFEKDARRGTLLGKMEGDTLDLVWSFTQEGMPDTLRVVFALQGGRLTQKPLSVDTATGRQVTRDTSRFSVLYEPVDCASD
jgi:hypothetical protein